MWHQHAVRLEHQSDFFVGYTPGFELPRAQQMQEVVLAVALDPLIRVAGQYSLRLPGLRFRRAGVAVSISSMTSIFSTYP